MDNKLLNKNHLNAEQFQPKEDTTKADIDRLDAQVTYTAIMTDTLVEDEE